MNYWTLKPTLCFQFISNAAGNNPDSAGGCGKQGASSESSQKREEISQDRGKSKVDEDGSDDDDEDDDGFEKVIPKPVPCLGS